MNTHPTNTPFLRTACFAGALLASFVPALASADVCTDDAAPTISITSPEDQSMVEAGAEGNAVVAVGILTSDAEDSCACGVTSAWLEIDGTAGTPVDIPAAPVAPNTATESIDATLTVGMHSIVAVAADCEGNEGRSEAVQVAVFEGSGTTTATTDSGSSEASDSGSTPEPEAKGCSIGTGLRPTVAFGIVILGALSLRRRRD